jgi:hypothetical protein
MDEKVPETAPAKETTAVVTSPSTQGSRETAKLGKIEELRRKSADYLDAVSGGKKLDPEDKNWIIKHTLENFDDYFNRGFLHYRKSVAEAEDFALNQSPYPDPSTLLEDVYAEWIEGKYGLEPYKPAV